MASKTRQRKPKSKSRHKIWEELLRARCDGCGDVTSVVYFDYYTRTGRKRRKKLCIGCKTGVYR